MIMKTLTEKTTDAEKATLTTQTTLHQDAETTKMMTIPKLTKTIVVITGEIINKVKAETKVVIDLQIKVLAKTTKTDRQKEPEVAEMIANRKMVERLTSENKIILVKLTEHLPKKTQTMKVTTTGATEIPDKAVETVVTTGQAETTAEKMDGQPTSEKKIIRARPMEHSPKKTQTMNLTTKIIEAATEVVAELETTINPVAKTITNLIAKIRQTTLKISPEMKMEDLLRRMVINPTMKMINAAHKEETVNRIERAPTIEELLKAIKGIKAKAQIEEIAKVTVLAMLQPKRTVEVIPPAETAKAKVVTLPAETVKAKPDKTVMTAITVEAAARADKVEAAAKVDKAKADKVKAATTVAAALKAEVEALPATDVRAKEDKIAKAKEDKTVRAKEATAAVPPETNQAKRLEATSKAVTTAKTLVRLANRVPETMEQKTTPIPGRLHLLLNTLVALTRNE